MKAASILHRGLEKIGIFQLLVLAAIVRIAVLFLLPDQQFPDANMYESSGRALLDTGVLSSNIYMPGYPLLMVLTGGGMAQKFADIILSIITVWLVYSLSLSIFSNRTAALLTALMAALYPHFSFYAVSRLSETTYLFLNCSAFLLFYKRKYTWGSLVLVLSLLVKPSAELLPPFLILSFVLIVHGQSWREAAFHVAKYGVIYIVLMTPWWIHNFEKYDSFVRLTLADGAVLYSGNNPMNRTGGGVSYGTVDDDVDLSPFLAIADPVDRNQAMKAAALDFVQENPKRVVELAGLKFVWFWRLWPFAPQYQQPHIIAASLLSYGISLALCLWFLVRHTFNHWRTLAPIFLYGSYLTAIHMITIGSIRYRFPLEPFILVIAGWTLVQFIPGLFSKFTPDNNPALSDS